MYHLPSHPHSYPNLLVKHLFCLQPVPFTATNPLFVSQTAARGNEPEYAALVSDAVSAAKKAMPAAAGGRPSADAINLAIDHLSVNLGRKILGLVKGYVSTEVREPTLSAPSPPHC